MPLKKVLLILWTLGSLNTFAAETLDLAASKVQTLSKVPTSLKEEFKGKILILDFWASWCGPCKESLPFYEDLQKRYSPQGLQVLAVSVDEDPQSALDFIGKRSFSIRILWDSNKELSKRLELKAIPTTLILDSSGKVLYRERGFVDSSKLKIEQQLLKVLPKK